MSAYDRVINCNLIVERFGGWPSFHDAEVVSVLLSGHHPNLPSCDMVVHAWLRTNEVDDRGYYVREKHSLVTLRFEELMGSEFSDFNHQNCLDSLGIEEEMFGNEPSLRVQFPTNYGLDGWLVCRRIVVIGVQPCDENARPEKQG